MENKEPQDMLKKEAQKTPDKRPNENGRVLVDGVVKIFDPETKEVFVEVRT